jgi:hypothetical protein
MPKRHSSDKATLFREVANLLYDSHIKRFADGVFTYRGQQADPPRLLMWVAAQEVTTPHCMPIILPSDQSSAVWLTNND